MSSSLRPFEQHTATASSPDRYSGDLHIARDGYKAASEVVLPTQWPFETSYIGFGPGAHMGEGDFAMR